jgi:hypothetical protein
VPTDLPTQDDLIWQEFDALDRELGGDVMFFVHTTRHQKSQHWRRAFCRAVAAYLEAMASWMARYTIQLYHPGQLGDEERQTLEARLSALERTFHAFDLFTNLAGAESPLEHRSGDWELLATMIRIRNRIVHPKRAEDARINDDEIRVICRTAGVVESLISETFFRTAKAHRRNLQKLFNEVERRISDPKTPSEGSGLSELRKLYEIRKEQLNELDELSTPEIA